MQWTARAMVVHSRFPASMQCHIRFARGSRLGSGWIEWLTYYEFFSTCLTHGR
jgi:hypothetical protein